MRSAAPCRDNHAYTAPVGVFQSNPFGLFDIIGNAREVLSDCRNRTYEGSPRDGAAWRTGDCGQRIARSLGWNTRSGWRIWPGSRDWVPAGSRNYSAISRVAVSMP